MFAFTCYFCYHYRLQAAEDFVVHLFEDSMLCAVHAKRVTLSKLNLFFSVPSLLMQLCQMICFEKLGSYVA